MFARTSIYRKVMKQYMLSCVSHEVFSEAMLKIAQTAMLVNVLYLVRCRVFKYLAENTGERSVCYLDDDLSL